MSDAVVPPPEVEALVERSHALGSDPRVTNYGGGNTSCKATVTDPVTGEPTGALKESATALVESKIPLPDAEARYGLLLRALRLLNGHGITSVQDAGSGDPVRMVALDVPLDVVAAERLAGPQRRLHVHRRARLEAPQRAAAQRLGDDVEVDDAAVRADRRQADAVDADGVAQSRALRGLGRPHPQPEGSSALLHSLDPAELPNDAREHEPRIVKARACRP